MEGAGSRQGLGTGPVTDPLGRPSQGVLENRTAAEVRDDRTDVRARSRRALVGVHNAEVQLLIASQRAARRAIFASINAGLSARHVGAIVSVVSRFADRRAGVVAIDQNARASALQQIAAEEAQELARLVLEHAAEKRALRSSALLSLVTVHRAERRIMRRRNRRQRVVAAIVLQPAQQPSSNAIRRAKPVKRLPAVVGRFGSDKQ